MFLMVNSSRKHVVNGCNIEVIEPTKECITRCVTSSMKREKGWGSKLLSLRQILLGKFVTCHHAFFIPELLK